MNLPILYLQLSIALRTGIRFKIGITRRGMIEAIGHIVKDDWYCPKEDFGGN